MGVRASHVCGACAASLALLLLLSQYTPPPPRPRGSARAHAEPRANATAPRNTTASANTTTTTTTTTTKVPAAAVNLTGARTAAASGAVLARDLYEAGHSSPHPELCPGLGRGVRLLALVTSAPSHAQARAGVRLTWGHYAARSDVTLGFMVGRTRDPKLLAALDTEDQLYGDVIRGNFDDSYSNLTLKTLSMLEWADTYCPRVRHLLKTDDDMFINVPRLLAFVDKHKHERRVIYGKVVRKWGPNRSKKSKYYVSPAQFPAKVFPNFATGPAYLVSGDVVGELYRRALVEPFVRLEDVFLTGLVADRLRIRRVHAPEFYNKKLPPHPCTVQRAISLHMVPYPDQFDLWRKLLDGKSKCANT